MDPQFRALAGEQAAMFFLSLNAIMGIVDGLVIKRVYFQYMAFNKVFTGAAAQMIGWFSSALVLVNVVILAKYLPGLAHYCHSDLACYVTTPISSIFFGWPVAVCYFGVALFFIMWVRLRQKDIRVLPLTPIALAPSGASIQSLIHARLAQAHEPQMSKQQVQDLRDKLDILIPLILLKSSKVVTDNKLVNPDKVARVILGTPDYRDKGKQMEIAVTAIVEAQVRSINENSQRHRLKRFRRS